MHEEPLDQISPTDWLSQWKSSFLPLQREAGKSYGVELLPLDGAIRQVGGPGTIEPVTFEVNTKAKTSRCVGEELEIRSS